MKLQNVSYKNRVLGAGLFVFLLSLVGGVMLVSNYHYQNGEVLVAWGVQDELTGNCSVWIIDATSKNAIQPPTVTQDNCNYLVVDIENRKSLASLTYPGRIIIYKITSEKDVVPEQVIDLGDWGFSSPPQWGKNGEIYFSSTINDVEQIFQANIQSGEIIPFIAHETGLATEPLISPDGHHLVYWTLDGTPNRKPHVCGLECNSGYYHVYNIVDQSDLYLLSLWESGEQAPITPHCNAQWSPTGRYLAFSIGGCSSTPPQSVVIFDTATNLILANIGPDLGRKGEFISLKGWLSETEIIYGERTIFPEMNIEGERYHVYSLMDKNSRELLDLPTYTERGQEFVLMEPNWTLDGKHFVGTLPFVHDNNKMGKDMVVISTDDALQFHYVYSQDNILIHPEEISFNTPKWSISGDWIAYHSSYREDATSSKWLSGLGIVDKTGVVFVHTGVEGVLESSLQYAWINP